jgi:2'-5' RNA ligase
MRIFLALLPPTTTRQELEHLQQQLPPSAGKKIAPPNLHLTLLFLGSVEAAQLQCLRQACGNIKVKAFAMTIDQLGWWKAAEIVWAGPTQPATELLELVSQVRTVAQQAGLEVDTRPYLSHITLSRKAGTLLPLPAFTPFEWTAHDFCLMESVATANGVAYHVLECWALQ